MIEKLRRIVLDVGNAQDLAAALRITVQRVREGMEVDACTIYLVDPNDEHLVMMENEGLDRAAIGAVRLAPGEGVIGLVRERREPVALDNAPQHPRFRHFPITGEAPFRAFLGVPIIHYRKVIGVLAVLQRGRRTFTTSHEVFLVTASAQLAGALAAAMTLSPSPLLPTRAGLKAFVQGIAGAPGVAIGTVVMPSSLAELESVPDRKTSDGTVEESAFREAVVRVQADLYASGERLKELLPSEAHALFEVYALLVGDESLVSRVVERIRQGQWAPAALRDTIQELAVTFEAIEDERLRARAEDIRAIGRRLLLELQVDPRVPREFPKRSVLVGDEVSLARIADVPRDRLAGVICFKSSALSHSAVVARALGIPAVMGLGDLSAERLEGHSVVVDGYRGRVFVDPISSVLNEFARLEHEDRELNTELEHLRDLPAETTDGVRVSLLVNTGPLTDIQPSLAVGAAGVGLYRSEFPFMLREAFPSEDEQYATYRQILEAFAPRPVVMRTLDIGGDKPLPYFPIEENNSLLGWRGVRVTLQHPEIFLAQLKAMLRANAEFGNLRLLLPMVTTAAEVREARHVLARAIESLSQVGVTVESPPLGVMIEVPGAIYAIDTLAAYAEFFSLGTNDLTQYLMAVDRGNPRVATLYDHLNPAVLRAVCDAISRAHDVGKPISLCGELAGDPGGALLLLAMGVDYLSVAASALPRTKWVIRSVSHAHATELLEEALRVPDARGVRQLVNHALEKAGLGGLLRAGR